MIRRLFNRNVTSYANRYQTRNLAKSTATFDTEQVTEYHEQASVLKSVNPNLLPAKEQPNTHKFEAEVVQFDAKDMPPKYLDGLVDRSSSNTAIRSYRL
jgi:hypothetical protein